MAFISTVRIQVGFFLFRLLFIILLSCGFVLLAGVVTCRISVRTIMATGNHIVVSKYVFSAARDDIFPKHNFSQNDILMHRSATSAIPDAGQKSIRIGKPKDFGAFFCRAAAQKLVCFFVPYGVP